MKKIQENTSHSSFHEYKLHPSLNDLNLGTWDFDCKTSTMYYSDEAKRILGYANSDLDFSQTNWLTLIYEKDFKTVETKFNSHLNNKTNHYKSEHRKLCKDGTYKWVIDYGKVIERDKFGNPILVTGTITDINIRKGLELDLIKNFDSLSKQNNILENFARIVTHNLKEYAGNFENLLGFYDNAETRIEEQEMIGHLKAVSKSLSKTITDLSEIVSNQNIKNLKRVNLNLYELIENNKILFEAQISNKGAVIRNNVDKKIEVYSNEAYISSVVQNITSNALKYAHPNRTLIINVNSYLNKEGLLKITIADNGIGIDLNKYGNDIFQLYKTFHGNKNAEGIGLYITKNQLEALGASIEVKSKVNVGTTFIITTSNLVKS